MVKGLYRKQRIRGVPAWVSKWCVEYEREREKGGGREGEIKKEKRDRVLTTQTSEIEAFRIKYSWFLNVAPESGLQKHNPLELLGLDI